MRDRPDRLQNQKNVHQNTEYYDSRESRETKL